MIALLGLGMVTVFLYLVLSKRLSPMVSLIVVPAAFALVGGFAPDLGDMVTAGIKSMAPTAAMLLFAILYFGIMIDAGLFDPIARVVVRLTGDDPKRLLVGTVALVALVSLDGDGTTTFMITVSALLPIYHKLGVSPVLMTGLACLTNAILNIVPWGGPAARAASALRLDPQEMFVPMIPALAAGLIAVFAIAYVLGGRERAKLRAREPAVAAASADTAGTAGTTTGNVTSADVTTTGGNTTGGSTTAGTGHGPEVDVLAADRDSLRPRMFWFNAALTVVLLIALIVGILPIAVLFMISTAVALIANYPRLHEQRDRIAAHADSVVAVIAMVFAASVFTGVLSGTGMVEQMANYLITAVPDALFPFFSLLVAVLSVPLTFFMSNDAFYFGLMPILAEAASQHGIGAMEIARASLLGQPIHMLSPLVPAMYVLIGLSGVDLADHHRFAIKWALVSSAVVIVAGLGFGLISVH